MNKIHVMSENLANKIAAGEVVEKCASVVKELVENSIDASANVIKIELVDGGLKGISVTDNGSGMNSEDAKLCFLRHATSKIINDEDLFFINTLGFRGEALPSIASVSEVVLETSLGDVGTLLHIKGGNVLKDGVGSARKGTKISISNLFYNTPARLKYLKSSQSELANCVSFIERLALSNPEIKFTLYNNEKCIINTSGSNNLLKVIHELFGSEVSSKMIGMACNNDDYEISGFIAKPEVLKSTRNYMITLVNGRLVKNPDLFRAINDGYYTYKPDNKYPVVVLNILVDPTLIDVNIHPTKQDIKLSNTGELYDLIVKTIKNILHKELLIPKVDVFSYKNIEPNVVESKIEEPMVDVVENTQITLDLSSSDEVVVNEELQSLVLYPVGLALGTYIIAQNESGIFLVDQHAAQERINYEYYLDKLKNKVISSTSMLFPLSVEFSPSDYITLLKELDFLESLGFKLEEFGINTIVVKEHPTWLKIGYEEESIRKIFDIVVSHDTKFDRVKFNEAAAIMLSCKMSIKANMHISTQEIERLLGDLVKTDNPYNCPHGRPTIIEFSKYDLEKMFKRVM